MIDWVRLERLRHEVGPEDFGEVVDLFLEEVGAVTARLARSPDPARYEEDLHLLKGSALNLGFKAFAALCDAGEKAAADGRADEVDLRPILTCYEASRTAFLTRLGHPALSQAG